MTGALAHPKLDLATAERELSVPKVAGRAACPPLQNPPFRYWEMAGGRRP
jgi:hypothetical protein